MLWPDGTRRFLGQATSIAGYFEWLPDYLCDLNAMHEAEKIFESDEIMLRRYTDALSVVVGRNPKRMGLFRATAAQRAEAFLRTLHLLDDSK